MRSSAQAFSGSSGFRGGRLIIAAVVAIGILVAGVDAFSAAYVEILWQVQSGYASIFWKRILWEWGISAAAGLGVAIIVFVNLKIASTTISGLTIPRRFGNLEISEQIPKRFVLWGMLAAAALLGLWFGASVPPNLGLQVLLASSAEAWGLIAGETDVGFYVFWLPVLGSAVGFALVVMFLIFTLVTASYAATGAIRWSRNRIDAQALPRLHLGILVGVFLLLLAGRLWLEGFYLLIDGNSAVQGIFGYTDAEARMPALQTRTVICVGAAAATVWGAWKNHAGVLIGSLGSVVIGTILIGQVWPSVIQRITVEPDQLQREEPYILENLEFTRIGFDLDRLERRAFDYAPTEAVDWTAAARQFTGLPVWNEGPLLATYRELEAQYPYYDFADVTIDRYPTASGPVAVALSVRQVDPGGILDPNWQNRHLRETYVVGMGTVASLAAVRTPQGRPEMLMTGIPPQVPAGARTVSSLQLDRPDIFFGTRPQDYAVVSPDNSQYLAPDSTPGIPGDDFPLGIELTSGLRKALLAWHFGDIDLFVSEQITDASRFIYRRRAVERALAIAPFLRFPEEPYPVVAQGRVFWMLEGFTGTGAFPLSTANDFGPFRSVVRYVRNSVKVTVDAVTGRVEFYRVPIDDPLADAYDSAFPGLFKEMEDMPLEIRGHLRYPRSLLSLQSRVLLQYHQETALAFHGQSDVWDEPRELAQNTSPIAYRPEYGLYTLPGEAEARFHLTTVFVPVGRQNLTGVLIGRTDALGVPELILIDVPVADQVPGPRQIEAMVEQDPEISEQFSLWRTGGSEVWTGHLHLVPVGNRLVYMEPVFLAAEADAIPELRRFVVSDGLRVAMTENLDDAIRQLAGLEVAGVDLVGVDLDGPVTDLAASPPDGADPAPAAEWPSAALDLLERAEASAREGDWQGFGEALDELRALLEGLETGGS